VPFAMTFLLCWSRVLFNTIVDRIKTAVPELLKMNGSDSKCILHFIAERRDGVA